MRSLSERTISAVLLALILLAGGVPFAPAARADSCAEWELVWTDPPPQDPNPGGRVPPGFYSGPNPVRASSTPALPPLVFGEAKWQCSETVRDSSRTEEEKKAPAGMELCAKAAELIARFAGFTILNVNVKEKLQTAVLDHAQKYIAGQFEKATNIKLDFSNLEQTALNAGKELVGDWAKDLWDSSGLRKEINDKIKKIEEEALKKLTELGGKAAEKVVDAAKSIVNTEVPVKDSEAIRQQKKIEEKQDLTIVEQKIAQTNADTREKCAALLKTTNETIKKTLLFQLSTQVVDWIQTGKTPQFVKQPGAWLEDSGRLALDRFISRTAPRLCQSFRVKVQLEIPSVQKRDNPFYEEVTCSLDRVVKNTDAFYKDFRRGGWVGYYESLKPKNNYFGASLIAQDQAFIEQARAKEEAVRDLAAGRGYRSQRQCVEWAKYIVGVVPDPLMLANTISVGTRFFIRTDTKSGATEDNKPPEAEGYEEAQGAKDGKFWAPDKASFWQCERDEITNPGTVAAGLSEKLSQSDFETLANSDDVSAFLQTIEDAIVNKLTKAGVKGLKSLLPDILPK